MLNLIRAEWLKLTKRPLTWILLVVFLALLALQFIQFLFVATVGALVLNPAQVDEMRRRLMFPGMFGAAFGHINGLGGIFAVILTAGALGSEYSWGTLRVHLARQPSRTAFLLAKLITVLLLLVVGMLITLALSVVLGLALGAFLGGSGAFDPGALAALPLALLRALYVLLPYILLTFSFTVYGRSLLVGLAGGLVYQVFDITFGAVVTFARLGGVWRFVYNLIIQANINTLTWLNSTAFGLDPAAIDQGFDVALLPSPLQATLVIGFYCAVFLATSLWLFRRRDVMGAS
jgi:ABC-type transport system involved in multi-copper enzyme maturation permease subunit